MKQIVLEIPQIFEIDYDKDKFREFFNRVLADIDYKGACGLYEQEIAQMFIRAFDESRTVHYIDKKYENKDDFELRMITEEIKNRTVRSNY